MVFAYNGDVFREPSEREYREVEVVGNIVWAVFVTLAFLALAVVGWFVYR